VFSLVRKACLRTLHCEVFEDPIYFDDDKNGSVIGYEFHVKDSEGRGFQRSYSLIIIMKDRIYLQHLWSFLQRHLTIVAQNIKAAAQKLFDKEVKENSINLSSPPLVSVNRSRDPVSRKKSNKSNRGLIELTNDNLIFAKLHMWFTWILRASACQISEEFLYGPLIEDLQIKLEEFKLNNFDVLNNRDCDNSLLMVSSSDHDVSDDIYLLEINDYQTLIKKITYDNFHALAYHIIVGNQIMIRCKYRLLVSSILKLFEQLIPYGCRKPVYYSNEYVNSYKCNLLGLSLKFDPTLIDNHNSDEYILLDIHLFKSSLNDLNNTDDLIDNYLFKVNVKTNAVFPIQSHLIPNVLLKMESFILNKALDSTSILSLINWIREELLK
jgi:folliculin